MLRDSVLYVGMERLAGEDTHLLEGPAAEVPEGTMLLEFGRIRVWVGAAAGLVRKKVMYDPEGEEVMSEIRSQVEVDVDLPDSTFAFTPPEGVQVMDMTEAVVRQARATRAGAGDSTGQDG